MAVQEPLLVTLWHNAHAPISTLALILMGYFLAGRILCLLYSDKIGLKRVWFIALLAQTTFLLGLGLLMLESMGKSLKELKFAVLCLYFAVVPAFKSTMAGLSHDVYGDQYRLVGTAAMMLSVGIAGTIGPVAIDAIHSHFHSYTHFFFGSTVLSTVGAVVLLPVQLPETAYETTSSIQDRAQESGHR